MPTIIPLSELRSLTPEQLAQKYSLEDIRATRETAKSRRSTDAAPSGDLFSMDTLRTAGENLWPDLKKNISAIPQAPAALWNLGKTGVAAVRGDESAQQDLMSLGREWIRPYTSTENYRQYLTNEPVSALMDLSPVLGRLSKSTKLPRLAQRALAVASPGRIASEGVQAVARGGEHAADLGYGLLRVTTGQPGAGALRLAVQAGRKGQTAAFRAGRRMRLDKSREGVKLGAKLGRKAGEHVTDVDMVDLVRDIVGKTDDAVDADLLHAASTELRGSIVDPTPLLATMDREFKNFGLGLRAGQTRKGGTRLTLLTPSPTMAQEGQRVVQKAVQLVQRQLYSKSGKPRTVTLEQLNNMRRAIGDLSNAGQPGPQALIYRLEKQINDFIDTKTTSTVWRDARRKASEQLGELGEIRQAFQIPPVADSRKNQAILRALGNALSPSNPRRAELLERMEKLSDIPLQSLIAGMALSEVVPKGLIGRAAFAGYAGTVMASGLGGVFVNPALLIGLPMTMPRVVGTLLSGLGVATRPVAIATDYVSKLWRVPGVQELAEQGMNIGTITERVRKDREMRRAFLSQYGVQDTQRGRFELRRTR